MALEDLTGLKYINSLVATNPVGGTDTVSSLDDHIKGIKNVVLNTFANITGAVTPTQLELNKLSGATFTTAEANKLSGLTASTTELNYSVGLVGAIQTQINTINSHLIAAGDGLSGGGYIGIGSTTTLTLKPPLSCNPANLNEIVLTGHRHAIDPLTIATGMLQTSAVTTEKLADLSVLENKLGAGAVTETKLGAGAVTATKLGDNSVGTTKLIDGATTAVKLATGSGEVDWVLARTAGASFVGVVGTYAFLFNNTGLTVAPGATVTGANLKYTDTALSTSVSYPVSGTWRCMGYVAANQATLWLRIS